MTYPLIYIGKIYDSTQKIKVLKNSKLIPSTKVVYLFLYQFSKSETKSDHLSHHENIKFLVRLFIKCIATLVTGETKEKNHNLTHNVRKTMEDIRKAAINLQHSRQIFVSTDLVRVIRFLMFWMVCRLQILFFQCLMK